jgi:flagellar basal-body rod protein FlgF
MMAYDISAVAAAMDQKIMQLEHISTNLANASTPGYKAEHLLLLNSLQQESRPGESASSLTSLVVDFARGILQKTDNPLDVSLQGDGFFVVQTQDGQAFTRKGDFRVNRQNQLITQAGEPVLGDAGPITLGTGKARIAADGAVFSDENQVGKLRVVDFTKRSNLKNVGSMFVDDGTAGQKNVENPQIAPGSLELSNVNAVNEMAGMIDIHRTFEMYQKIIQTLSEQDKLSVSRVGKV